MKQSKKRIQLTRVRGIKKYSLDITAMYILAGIAVLVGIGILLYAFASGNELSSRSLLSIPDIENTSVEDTELLCEVRRVIDGVCVSPGEENPRLIAVMIENHFESWPLSGLSKANVVYEAPVEGSIPRFLALFTAQTAVDKVGPIRSARPYYLDWLREYGTPLYLHVGGSDAALAEINASNINDLNEFYRGWYFWRDHTRYAPHNAYSGSNLWNDALDQYVDQYTKDTYTGWKFDHITTCTEGCTSSVRIMYAGNTYTTAWKYNTTTEQYIRFQAGEQQFDANGTAIEADTIIIQHVETAVLDGVGRLGMDTIGTGNVTILQKGHRIDGTWEKISKNARTTFFDETGTVIPLNPGQIWVQVIHRDDVLFE